MALLCKQSAKHVSYFSRCLCRTPSSVLIPLRNSTPVITTRDAVKKWYSTKNDNYETDDPVQFSTSDASKWKASYSRMGDKDDSPPAQPFVVSISVAVFLVYFLALREENDIDIKLGGGGFDDTRTYLEFLQLKTIVEQNERNSVHTDTEMLDRLKELENTLEI